MKLFNKLALAILLLSFSCTPPAWSSQYFTLGSSKELVKEVQGEPSEIFLTPKGLEIWRYGYSTIQFEQNKGQGAVNGWNNTGNLKTSLRPENNNLASKFFSRGSSKDEILILQGTPSGIDTESYADQDVWRYGYSTVSISKSDLKVVDWSNSGNLKVKIQQNDNSPNGSSFFTLGSDKDDVINIQGTPSAINSESVATELWRYGYDTVKISKISGKVIGWNSTGRLKVKMQPEKKSSKNSFFDHGSHKDDVLRLQGTPHGITRNPAMGAEIWRYGYSTVTISIFNGKISSYENNGNLKVPKNKQKPLRLIKYHSRYNGLTMFYDENLVYGNLFSIEDNEIGNLYGITQDKIISFYNENLSSMDLYVYLLREKTLKAVSPGGSFSTNWLENFSKRLAMNNQTTHFNGITIYNILQDSGPAVSGSSLNFKSISVDKFKSANGDQYKGTRIKIGGLVLGSWWKSDGSEVKGLSKKSGNVTLYHFTLPDGEVISGTTLDIGSLSLPENYMEH